MLESEYQKEEWVSINIEGCEDKYLISSYGRVFNNKSNKYVAQVLTGGQPYFYVNLAPNKGKRILRRVHNIMALSFLSFLGDPQGDETADHIDQNHFNNALYNIRWASRKEQTENRGNTIYYRRLPLIRYLEEQGVTDKIEQAFLRQWIIDKEVEFEDAIQKLELYNKYGRSHVLTSKFKGQQAIVCKWCEEHSKDFHDIKDKLSRGWSLEDCLIGLKFQDYPNSVEVNNVWFPTKRKLCEYYNISERSLRKRESDGMTLKEALEYKYDPLEDYRMDLDGFYMTKKEHCERVGTTLQRVETSMRRRNVTFEEALRIKPKKIIKHIINGEVKRNKAWFEYFGLNPKTANNKLSKCKSMKVTLEYFGIDTSEMTIEPFIG